MNVKPKISVLDQAKGAYVKATTNIDQNLHDQITPVNDTIYATREHMMKELMFSNVELICSGD